MSIIPLKWKLLAITCLGTALLLTTQAQAWSGDLPLCQNKPSQALINSALGGSQSDYVVFQTFNTNNLSNNDYYCVNKSEGKCFFLVYGENVEAFDLRFVSEQLDNGTFSHFVAFNKKPNPLPKYKLYLVEDSSTTQRVTFRYSSTSVFWRDWAVFNTSHGWSQDDNKFCVAAASGQLYDSSYQSTLLPAEEDDQGDSAGILSVLNDFFASVRTFFSNIGQFFSTVWVSFKEALVAVFVPDFTEISEKFTELQTTIKAKFGFFNSFVSAISELPDHFNHNSIYGDYNYTECNYSQGSFNGFDLPVPNFLGGGESGIKLPTATIKCKLLGNVFPTLQAILTALVFLTLGFAYYKTIIKLLEN